MEPRFCSLTSNTVAPFQGGEVRDIKIERREATLFGANGAVKIEPRSAPYFVEVTNRFLLLRPIGLARCARLRLRRSASAAARSLN